MLMSATGLSGSVVIAVEGVETACSEFKLSLSTVNSNYNLKVEL